MGSESHSSPNICCCSVVQLCQTLCDPMPACQASLSFTISWSLLKVMFIESVMPSNHLILCHPLLLMPSIFPCIRVFSNESALYIRCPKHWSFSISPSNEYSGLFLLWLISLLSKGLSRVFSSTSIQKHQFLHQRDSAFFMVQLSHPCMTTGKAMALTRWTFLSKPTSLLFNILLMFVIAFLPRNKHLLISCLQSQSAVILEPKRKSLWLFSLCPHVFAMKLWNWMSWS